MKEPDFKPKFSNSAQVLHSLFQNGKSPLSEQFIRWKLWAQWKEIAGATLSENAEPVGISKGTLVLWVKNSSWMQQLYFIKKQILKNIETQTGINSIKDIQFTLDRRSVPASFEQQNELREFVKSLVPESDSD